MMSDQYENNKLSDYENIYDFIVIETPHQKTCLCGFHLGTCIVQTGQPRYCSDLKFWIIILYRQHNLNFNSLVRQLILWLSRLVCVIPDFRFSYDKAHMIWLSLQKNIDLTVSAFQERLQNNFSKFLNQLKKVAEQLD